MCMSQARIVRLPYSYPAMIVIVDDNNSHNHNLILATIIAIMIRTT